MLSSNSNYAFQVSNKTQEFSLYPNPAKDILHVQTNSAASFSLINQLGKVILTTRLMIAKYLMCLALLRVFII
jgi:hypothetical protein